VPTPEEFLAERRKHPRHPIEAQVTALFSEFWVMGDMNILLGWTHNVSEGGVCFSLPYHIDNRELVLHIDYDGMGAEYVLASVIQVVDLKENGWQYHCRIDRMLSSIHPFDCIQESMLGLVQESAGQSC
jgi:hypothetical protein